MAGSQVGTLIAAIGGINAYDSLLGMPETDAISLVNLVPQQYGCQLRLGFAEHQIGLGEGIRTLVTWNGQPDPKMYAFAGDKMYDVSIRANPPVEKLDGLSSDVWFWTTLANSGGTNLVAFDGIDEGIVVNSTGIHRLIEGDGVVAYTIKGIDPSKLGPCTMHQARLWAAEMGTTFGWYLPPSQAYGEMTLFDFGPIFKRGGTLVNLVTWTVDVGDGSSDNLCAISSHGEIAVYKGTDPDTEGSWMLQGVYFCGAVVSGHRSAIKVGADVQLLTEQGLVSLTGLLSQSLSSQTPAQDNINALKVQQPLSAAASALRGLFGWQLFWSPEVNFLIVNLPGLTSLGSTQFIENTVNAAWCQFEGYDANCWVSFNNNLYYGMDDGRVIEAWTGHTDNHKLVPDAFSDQPIVGRVQQSYSYLHAPAAQKQLGMYRPNFLVESPCTYGSMVNYDFAFKSPPLPIIPPPKDQSLWDIAKWDQNFWSGSLNTQKAWSQAEGMGVAASFSFTIRSSSALTWVSTDYTYYSGGGVL